MARRLVPLLVIASFALLVFTFAGCGGDDNSASGDTTTTETTTTEDTTTDTETTETETTETETTEEEDTDTTETSALGDDFATSDNCQEFEEFGQRISQAFTGSESGDLQAVKEQLQTFADEAPDEIRSDFQTLADGYAKIADALEGVDLQSGQTPDPQALAKLSQLGTEWSTKMSTAAQNIGTWAQENCT